MTTGNIAAGNIAKISGLPRDTDIMQYRKTTPFHSAGSFLFYLTGKIFSFGIDKLCNLW